MIQLLYIGNNLKQDSSNPSVMSTLGPLLEREGFKLCYASSKKNKVSRLFDMVFQVVGKLHKVDVVLIDTYSTQNFYYALIVSQVCRLLRLSYIPILHGGNLPNRLIANPKMSALIFNHAHCNVAPSNYLKEQFEAHGYTNLKYIPNSIEIGNYPFFKHSCSTPKLLWVRSFSKIYNPSMAVHVLKHLRDRGTDATLCMVGPDSDGSLQDVKDLANHLGVDVKFTGKLSKSEWIQLSRDYTIFINTTTIDNMPVSVIETMALGLPIVSTNVGGMPYLIENDVTGLLVAPNDVEDMANAINKVFKDSVARDHMVSNARALAETFDWNAVRSAWNAVLNNDL